MIIKKYLKNNTKQKKNPWNEKIYTYIVAGETA